MAAGFEGFRRSHRQAQAGRDVALARGEHGPTVIAAADSGLAVAALLCNDIDPARVWVAEALLVCDWYGTAVLSADRQPPRARTS